MYAIHTLPNETWIEAVKRLGAEMGKEAECVAKYHERVAAGYSERAAAFYALYGVTDG